MSSAHCLISGFLAQFAVGYHTSSILSEVTVLSWIGRSGRIAVMHRAEVVGTETRSSYVDLADVEVEWFIDRVGSPRLRLSAW